MNSLQQLGTSLVGEYSTKDPIVLNVAKVPARVVCGLALSVVGPLTLALTFLSDPIQNAKKIWQACELQRLFVGALDFCRASCFSSGGMFLARSIVLAQSWPLVLATIALGGGLTLLALQYGVTEDLRRFGSTSPIFFPLLMKSLESLLTGMVVGWIVSQQFKAEIQPLIDQEVAQTGPHVPAPEEIFVNTDGEVVRAYSQATVQNNPSLFPGVMEKYERLIPLSERPPTICDVFWRSAEQFQATVKTWHSRWVAHYNSWTDSRGHVHTSAGVGQVWDDTPYELTRGTLFSTYPAAPGWLKRLCIGQWFAQVCVDHAETILPSSERAAAGQGDHSARGARGGAADDNESKVP